MERKRLLELAISGVRQDLNALENELRAISKGIAAGTRSLVSGKKPGRKKRGMSAANRKAQSERMKKFWAARRKAKAKK